MPSSQSKLIGIPELAAALKLKTRTVADPKWREALGIPQYYLNPRCVRFDLDEVLTYLKKTTRHHGPTEEATNEPS